MVPTLVVYHYDIRKNSFWFCDPLFFNNIFDDILGWFQIIRKLNRAKTRYIVKLCGDIETKEGHN